MYGIELVHCITLFKSTERCWMLFDLQFIQKPDTGPDVCLQLLVPSSAVLHQSALGHYLRQNLMQFMFIPKYQEGGRPENMFQDYTAPGGSCSSTDSDVYLYRPQMGGSKGMNSLVKQFFYLFVTLVFFCGSMLVKY